MSSSAQKNLFNFLVLVIRPYYFHLTGILLAMMYVAAHQSLVPYVLKLIIDTLTGDINVSQTDFSRAYVLGSSLIALELGLVAIWRVQDYCLLNSFPNIKSSVMSKVFKYISYHSHQFFIEQHSGDISGKIVDFADNFEKILEACREIFKQIAIVLIAASMLLFIHIIFGLIILIWSVAFVFATVYLSKGIFPRVQNYAIKRSESSGNIVDATTNISSVRLFSQQNYEHSRLSKLLEGLTKEDQHLKWGWFKAWFWMGIFYCAMLSAIIFSVIYLRSQEGISVGSFAFVILLSIAIIEPVWLLTEQITNLSESVGVCQEAFKLIKHPHDVQDIPNAPDLVLNAAAIEFKHIYFAYNIENPLFENLSVFIPGGQKTGLVGLSGSGKSTFVNLLIRSYDAQKGSIEIDKQDISKVTQKSLTESIGFIPQDPLLFHRSIFENIQYGKANATKKEVIEASKKAYADQFISDLPQKYDSLVGERGVKLSGGQRQRIAIARAFLKEAPILILDEATSALDSVTEQYIQESLKILMCNRTVIVVAHRLSTLLMMDRILVFDNGKIVEEGTHQELLMKKGTYAQLWNAQVAGFLPS